MNPFLQDIVKINAGNEHSLALTKTGDMYIWGSGALTGFEDVENKYVPTKHKFFKNRGLKISKVACGGLHSCVITTDGNLYTWGSNEGDNSV